MTSNIEKEHAKLYKNSSKTEDFRRRRNETSIELRRQRREDDMMKRRNINVDSETESDASMTLDDNGDSSIAFSKPKCSVVSLNVSEVCELFANNPSVEELQKGFESIRRLLSRNKDPPIKEVINKGLVEALVKGLIIQNEKIQFECAWSLTNIVSGSSNETAVVINFGGAKPLLNLVCSDSEKLAEQAIWAVANIVGDSVDLRDLMVVEGLVDVLHNLVQNIAHFNTSFVKIIAWTYSNLVRHKNPQLGHALLLKITQDIVSIISYSDMNVRQDCCWALSYSTDGPDPNIRIAEQCGVLPYMVQYIDCGKDSIAAPALRVLGNFATGDDELTQLIVDSGILTRSLPNIFEMGSGVLVKESCWLISNITAGTLSQIQAVIDAKLLPYLFNILKTGDSKSKYESSWAIANITHGGTSAQILQLLDVPDSIEIICGLLNYMSNEIIHHSLTVINAILEAVEKCVPVKLLITEDRIESCGGLDHLEKLQAHEQQAIYEVAFKIISNYFHDENEESVENIEPEDMTTPNTTFNF